MPHLPGCPPMELKKTPVDRQLGPGSMSGLPLDALDLIVSHLPDSDAATWLRTSKWMQKRVLDVRGFQLVIALEQRVQWGIALHAVAQKESAELIRAANGAVRRSTATSMELRRQLGIARANGHRLTELIASLYQSQRASRHRPARRETLTAHFM